MPHYGFFTYFADEPTVLIDFLKIKKTAMGGFTVWKEKFFGYLGNIAYNGEKLVGYMRGERTK